MIYLFHFITHKFNNSCVFKYIGNSTFEYISLFVFKTAHIVHNGITLVGYLYNLIRQLYLK
jgi:hypothetical protein